MDLQDRVLLCKLAVKVILADQSIELAESEWLDRLMKRQGLTEEQVGEVLHNSFDAETEKLIDQLSASAAKSEVMETLAQTVVADGRVADEELWLLKSMASRIGFPEPELQKLLGL